MESGRCDVCESPRFLGIVVLRCSISSLVDLASERPWGSEKMASRVVAGPHPVVLGVAIAALMGGTGAHNGHHESPGAQPKRRALRLLPPRWSSHSRASFPTRVPEEWPRRPDERGLGRQLASAGAPAGLAEEGPRRAPGCGLRAKTEIILKTLFSVSLVTVLLAALENPLFLLRIKLPTPDQSYLLTRFPHQKSQKFLVPNRL